MAANRKPCPKHTTGNGPCYCQYHRDNNDIYHAPADVKECLSAIYKIARGKLQNELTPGQAAKIRQININFIRSRIPSLSGVSLSRAFETIKNLRG